MFERAVEALQRRAIGRAAAEDAAQEAIVRAFSAGPTFATIDELTRWVQVVARRIAVDEYRRHGRRHAVATDLPHASAPDDVAAVVEGRLEWQAAATAWVQLSDADRAALTATEHYSDRRAAVRNAVRRHRARARLVAYMEAASAVVVAWLLGRPRRAVVVTAAATALPFVAFVVIGGFQTPTDRVALGAPPGDAAARTDSSLGTARDDPLADGAPESTTANARGIKGGPDRGAQSLHEVDVAARDPQPAEPVVCGGNTQLGTLVCVDSPVRPKLSDLDEPVEHLPSPVELLP